MAGITVQSLDHVVLTVRNIVISASFYTKHLGMRHEQFGHIPERHSLVFGSGHLQQKLNLHEVGKEFLPRAQLAKPGTADLCLITRTPIEHVRDKLWQAGVKLETLALEQGMQGGKKTEEQWQGYIDTQDQGTEAFQGAIVNRTGARGKLRSVYFRDPDENLIEISNYDGEVD